jgi:hypothetical protein
MNKIQIQRIQTKNKTVFIPDKAHKQNLPPYQHKMCAQSETFCTSYPLFCSVVFRETTSTEHTFSILLLIFFHRIVSERNSWVNVRI